MTVVVGLILSAIVIVAAIVYSAQEDRYPDLAFIRDGVALAGAVVGLTIIWFGVAVVALVRKRRNRPTTL